MYCQCTTMVAKTGSAVWTLVHCPVHVLVTAARSFPLAVSEYVSCLSWGTLTIDKKNAHLSSPRNECHPLYRKLEISQNKMCMLCLCLIILYGFSLKQTFSLLWDSRANFQSDIDSETQNIHKSCFFQETWTNKNLTYTCYRAVHILHLNGSRKKRGSRKWAHAGCWTCWN